MRIGVVSDTHLHCRNVRLPDALVRGLDGVDLILHAGDWVSERVADELELIAPVDGIAGNNDGFEIVDRFGLQKLLQVEGVTIGLIHGDGHGKTTEKRAFDAFAGRAADIIIFGHSHIPYQERRGGSLLFNPGSPTDKRRQPRFSYGVIEISNGNCVEARHFYFDSKS
ncbi:MAG: phosphodiesterase family protein [Paenibacillaceae bacterium]|jgi:putative phosphoesterase|nr:phosphodiesterase family protein [Paenibacillaceae bacterium]